MCVLIEMLQAVGLTRLRQVTGDDRVYEAVSDPNKLSKLMENYLEEYNMSTPKTMNLVFFIDAIEHISRLARILRSPRGNAMLVGLGGSGVCKDGRTRTGRNRQIRREGGTAR